MITNISILGHEAFFFFFSQHFRVLLILSLSSCRTMHWKSCQCCQTVFFLTAGWKENQGGAGVEVSSNEQVRYREGWEWWWRRDGQWGRYLCGSGMGAACVHTAWSAQLKLCDVCKMCGGWGGGGWVACKPTGRGWSVDWLVCLCWF